MKKERKKELERRTWKETGGTTIVFPRAKNGFIALLLELYLGLCQTSMMEIFAAVVKGLKQLIVFAKSSILHVFLGPK